MRPVIAYPGVAGSFSESAAQCAFPQGETQIGRASCRERV